MYYTPFSINARYQKQNILAIHIAKVLSQKKHRKRIGAVHISIDSSDLRRVVLILTPPLQDEDVIGTDGGSVTNERSKKRRKGNSDKDVTAQSTEKKGGKAKRGKQRYRLRLVFGMQGNPSNRNFWIPPARLFPDRCNNRVESISNEGDSGTDDPTPTYNSLLARDIHHVATSRIIHSMSKACAAFNEALILTKVWCLQRGLLRGHDALDTTSLALLLVYLYRTKKVGTRMGSIQVFTILMKFIAETDWLGEGTSDRNGGGVGDDGMGSGDKIRYSASEGYQATIGSLTKKLAIVLPEEGISESKTIDHCVQSDLYLNDLRKTGLSDKSQQKTLLDCFKVHFPGPVFLDPTMTFNYLGSVSPSFVRELQGEAKKAIFSLHLHSDDPRGEKSPFRHLFLEGCRFWRRYDAYVHLDLNEMEKSSTLCHELDSTSDVGRYESISRSVVQLLRMALGDRITAIRALTRGNGEGALLTSKLIDTDQAPSISIRGAPMEAMTAWGSFNRRPALRSPMTSLNSQGQTSTLVIGLRINSQTCSRIVDRGPPANDTGATSSFVALWGKERAQLRRFKDGAIVHAVLWNADSSNTSEGYLKFSGDERCGGIVERVVRHIVPLHFAPSSLKKRNKKQFSIAFGLRNIMSLVEGVSSAGGDSAGGRISSGGGDSTVMHKDIMSAFDSLTSFLRQNSIAVPVTSGSKEMQSKLGLPLAIDAVEPLSSSLRYSELFPPEAHPLLGGKKKASSGSNKAAGVTTGPPILVQVRFEGNSKWPNDVKAISAAKCALLIQLAEGIETMKRNGASECVAFDGPIHVMPSYMDVGYLGYSWRIMIRADQELKLLNSLRKPTLEAVELRRVLAKRHISSALHHSTVHSVNTQYPSAGLTMRLAMRWVHSHMLSGLLPQEAVEILVGKVFVDAQPLEPPATAMSGFLRFLRLLSSHDWARQPLIFDPQGSLTAEDYARVQSDFLAVRGEEYNNGPSMFLITLGCFRSADAQPSPGLPGSINRQNDNCMPTFTRENPEQVVLSRLVALAKRSELFLLDLLVKGEPIRLDGNNSWASAFHENVSSLKSYSVLLRVDPHIAVDPGCSSTAGDCATKITEEGLMTPFTRSATRRSVGPKALRIHTYKNIGSSAEAILHGWCPIANLVDALRAKFGSSAVFFYNALAPDIIALLWRPTAFSPVAFTAMHSEYKRPAENKWQEDGFATQNAEDLLRKICHIANSSVTEVKLLDDRSVEARPMKAKAASIGGKNNKRKVTKGRSGASSSEDDSSSDEEN